MKQKLTLCLLLFSFISFSQVPDLINYQGIARDANGTPITGSLGVKFELRQGSVSSPTVFTEEQTVTTSPLGLFNTQIGKQPGSALNNVNWEGGALFLEVSLSLAGGSYTSLGVQQLVSVPFSKHAQSVPATYSNNVLTIGSGSAARIFTLNPAGSPTTFSAGQNITIQGSHPDYTISSTPSLSISNNSLSISGGNMVLIPTVAAATTSVVSSGAATTTTLGTNSFSIDVAVPTFSNSDQNIITGTYPSFIVNTPTMASAGTTTLVASGAAVNTTLSANSYSIYVPPVSVALTSTGTAQSVSSAGINSVSINIPTVSVSQGTGGVNVTGAYPNYTISGATGNSTITGAGAAIVSPASGNDFTVTVPPVDVALTSTGSAMGVTNVGTNSVSINIPVVSVSGGSNVTVGGSYPNYVVNSTPSLSISGGNYLEISNGNGVFLPSSGTVVAQTTTLQSSGITSLTILGANDYSLHTDPPSFTANGPVSIMGVYPNYTINSSAAASQSLSIAGGSVSISGGNSVALPNPSITITSTAAAGPSITSTGSSFSINIPSAAAPGITSQGLLTQTTSGSSFTLSVPAPTLDIASGSISISGGNAVAIPNPSITLTSTAAAGPSVTSTGSSFSINIPSAAAPGITSQGLLTQTTSGSSFTLSVPVPTLDIASGSISISGGNAVAIPNPSITSQGLLTQTTSGSSFTLSVPVPTLDITSGSISISGGNAVAIPNPSITLTSTAAAGPSVTSTGNSFSINIPSAAAPSITSQGLVTQTTSGSSFTLSVPVPTLDIASGSISISGGNAVAIPNPSITLTSTAAAGPSVTSAGSSFSINIPPAVAPNIAVSNTAGAAGISTTSANNFNINIPSPNIVVSNTAGAVGISTTSANDFNINIPPAVAPNIAVSNTAGAAGISTTSANNFNINIPSPNIVVSNTAGAVGVSTTSANNFNINVPSPNITISNTAGAVGISTTAANDFNINIPAANNWFLGGNSGTNPSTNYLGTSDAQDFALATSGAERLRISSAGLVGIAVATPSAYLHVASTNSETSYFEMNNSAGTSHALVATSNSGSQHTIRSLNTSAALTSYAGMFEGGILARGKNSGTAPVFKAQTYSGSDLFVVRSDGYVGIGSTSPAEFVQIQNTSADVQLSLISTAPHSPGLSFGYTGNHFMGNIKYDLTSNSMNFWTNNSPNRLVISSTGNIGIGTNAPNYDLSIYNSGTNAAFQLKNSASANLGFVIGNNNVATNILSYETTPMYFGNGGSNQMVLSAAGNLGIGNMSPSAKLDVAGNANINGSVKIADGTQGAGKVLASDAAGNASWQAVIPVPSGAVIAYAGPTTTIPSGWLICDGSAVSRTGFPNLFAAIGTSWGTGNGSTTFNVPDMRGMFLRGVDQAAGADPDKAARVANNTGGNTANNVGSEQADIYQTHSHTLSNNVDNTTNYSTLLGGVAALNGAGGASTTNASGGNETRPKNVYVYYIIKL